MDLREVKKYLKTCTDEEVPLFISHCERQLDNADEDIRAAAQAALKVAREDRAIRDLLRGIQRDPNGGE